MSEARTRLGDALRDRLESLEESGARGFDAPAIVLIEALLERAHRLEGAARGRVEGRAEARVARLEEDFETARVAAWASLERLDEALGAGASPLGDAYAAGRFEEIARAERRLRDSRPMAPAADGGAAVAYRDAVADFTGALSRARSPRAGHAEAGLLNGRRLAERALQAAGDLSPAYRRSLIVGLTDLAVLLHLPAVKTPRARP